MTRLVRHDGLIASNTVRATFANWQDRSIAAFMLLAGLAMVRGWSVDQPWRIVAWGGFVAGVMAGFGAGRWIAARLAFQGADGILAADALRARFRWQYRGIWLAAGLALFGAVLLIVRPALLAVGVAGYLSGALAAAIIGGLRWPVGVVRAVRPGRLLQAWAHRHTTGVGAALVLLAVLSPTRALSMDGQIASVVIGTVVSALLLTRVDDHVVRFMTSIGYGAVRITRRHAGGLGSFLAMMVPGCWVLFGTGAAAVVVVAGVAILLLLVLRILAYRLHARRFADILLSILVGVLVLIAYSMPFALPVAAVAVVWQLQRRGRAKTWLLA